MGVPLRSHRQKAWRLNFKQKDKIMDNTDEFQVGALTCRAKKMNARLQFHLARRLASVLGPIIPEVDKLNLDLEGESLDAEAMKLVPLIAESLADGDDAKFDYIMDACLSHVLVKQDGGGWAPLRANNVDMYALEMVDMLTAVGLTIMKNLAGFMAALPGDGKLAGLVKNFQKPRG